MKNIEFIQESHKYVLDGKEVPSVTQLVEIYSTSTVDADSDLELVFESAAERGTILHSYLEHRLSGGQADEFEMPDSYAGYVDAIELFLSEHELSPMLVETAMAADGDIPFAGTPDYVGEFDGVMCILDWKFVSQVQKTKIGAQLHGYDKLCVDNGIFAEHLYCVQFLADGGYRLYPVGDDSVNSFELCLQVHKLKNQKHPKGGIA